MGYQGSHPSFKVRDLFCQPLHPPSFFEALTTRCRLRYELLDNGSIARLVIKMAERLEYSAKRLNFAIVHCEFLFTLCDKVHRNPSSLLPVMVSEEVNSSGLGKELLLLNWTVQHLQVLRSQNCNQDASLGGIVFARLLCC